MDNPQNYERWLRDNRYEDGPEARASYEASWATRENVSPGMTQLLYAKPVQDALSRLEQAQRLVEEAAHLLCPVPGYADEWEDIKQLHAEVKRHWHFVESRRQELAEPQE